MPSRSNEKERSDLKGRFGGNVNINGGVLDTTTILRDKRKALPSGKAITLQSARPIFRQSGADVVLT